MSIESDFKEIVIARLETLPSNRKISIGSSGEFTKDELINSVKQGSPLGKKLVQIEMEFLQSLKKELLV